MEPLKKESSPETGIRRKSYRPPELFIYGDVRQITQSSGMTGFVNDGGMGSTKTH